MENCKEFSNYAELGHFLASSDLKYHLNDPVVVTSSGSTQKVTELLLELWKTHVAIRKNRKEDPETFEKLEDVLSMTSLMEIPLLFSRMDKMLSIPKVDTETVDTSVNSVLCEGSTSSISWLGDTSFEDCTVRTPETSEIWEKMEAQNELIEAQQKTIDELNRKLEVKE